MAHILLLHQDPIQRHFLATLLQQDRHRLMVSDDHGDIRQCIVAEGNFDGIVLDLAMVSCGWESYQPKRNFGVAGSGLTAPILGLSSYYSDSESQQICEEFQLDAFLALPVNPHRFRRSIQSLTDGSIKMTSCTYRHKEAMRSVLTLTSGKE